MASYQGTAKVKLQLYQLTVVKLILVSLHLVNYNEHNLCMSQSELEVKTCNWCERQVARRHVASAGRGKTYGNRCKKARETCNWCQAQVPSTGKHVTGAKHGTTLHSFKP